MAFRVHDVSPASRKILEVLVAQAFHKRNLGVVEKMMGTTDLQRDSALMDALLKLKGSLFKIMILDIFGYCNCFM